MVMLVKTVVKSSQIDGVGLFADEDIKKGTVVWRYLEGVDQLYTAEQIEQMTPVLRTFMKKYTYLHSATGNYVLCGDNGRFVNHATAPNVADYSSSDCSEDVEIALRDISKGEEIISDYFTFDGDASKKLPETK